MLKINKKALIFLGLVLSLGLAGCEGNSSSTNIGRSAVITPIEVDKNISAVQWSSSNVELMASHAYRAITQNTMVKTVFTNQLSSFDLLANLFRLSDVRNCTVSGRMIAESPSEECFLADGSTSAECDDPNAVVRKNSQISRAMACQDDGKYFDGFFNIIKTTDEHVVSESRTSTTISAVDKIEKLDSDGNKVLDEYGDPVFEEVTDYQFQSEFITFFFDNEYESYVNFLTAKKECGENEYTEVAVQGIKSDEVGAFEGDGITPYYLYTRFTDLNMSSTPIATCNSDDSLKVVYNYSFTAIMENAAMGGGDDAETVASWPDMEISSKGIPSGTLTLTHKNSSSSNYEVKLDFTTAGQVTITAPDLVNPLTTSLSQFLALSKPAPFVSEAE